jgi:hypothetical protein
MLVGRLPFCSKSISSSNLNGLENSHSNNEDFKDLFDKILKQDLYFPSDLNPKSRLILTQLLEKQACKRLGSSVYDFEEIKNHSFFNTIDWDKLVNKQLEPPFKPQVSSETDTCYFETQFTGENVKFTPPTDRDKQILNQNEVCYFDSFSFYGSKTSLNSQASHSSKKFQLDKCLNMSINNNQHSFDTQSLMIHDSMSINSNRQFNFIGDNFAKSSSTNNDQTTCPYFLASNAFPNIVRFTDSNGQLLQSTTFTSQLQQGLFYVSSSSSSSSLSRSSSIFNTNNHIESNDYPIDE